MAKNKLRVLGMEDVRIENIHAWDDGNANFTLVIDDIIFIHGMRYIRNKKNSFIAFPSFKVGRGKSEKYLKHAYVSLSDALQEAMIKIIEDELEE